MENSIVIKIPGLIAFAVHEGINELRQLNLATTIYGKINSEYLLLKTKMCKESLNFIFCRNSIAIFPKVFSV